MTVYMVRVFAASEDPNGNDISLSAAQTTVQNWLDNHSEVLTEYRSEVSLSVDPEGQRPDFFAASFRFDFWDSAPTILDNIETGLDGTVSWYRVLYHQCGHDDTDNRGSCSWDGKRESSGVPSSIPDFDI